MSSARAIMKEGLIKDVWELVVREIQAVITLAYILAVGIGMIFNARKYGEFSINIFDYGDVFDFLIAPFADIYILIYASASTLFIGVLFYLDALWMKKWPISYSIANFGRDKKNWFRAYRTILIITCLVLYLLLSADCYGQYTKQKILEQNDIAITMADNEVKIGKLIGNTKDMLFLYSCGEVHAIPMTTMVKDIRIR